ncbi:MAG TPA: pyridoxamine 5'-phosphate oxidase family protein [Thermoleophilaceae bacterium]
MRETSADLEGLQALLDRSSERASSFLRTAFRMPEHSLSAAQLCAHLEGALQIAFATVTARGEPRVAPINAFFLRAVFYVPTVAEATRARHLARRPGASLTYYEGEHLAVIGHGRATQVGQSDPEFAELDATQVECGQQSPLEWSGTGVYLRFEPDVLYTFALEPGNYPG